MKDCQQAYDFTVNLQFTGLGTAINSAYPAVIRADTFNYPNALALMGFVFSSVIRSETSVIAGVWLVKNKNIASMTLTQDAGVLASSLSGINSNTAAAIFNPASMTYSTFYPKGNAVYLPPRSPISLYVCAANAATELIGTAVTLYFSYAK